MKYAVLLLLAACGDPPAKVATLTVENQLGFPLDKVIYTTGTIAPLAANATADPIAITPAFDFGYALSGGAVMRTSNKLSTSDKGSYTLIFDGTFRSKCTGLSQAEYEDIATRVFPDDTVAAFEDVPCYARERMLLISMLLCAAPTIDRIASFPDIETHRLSNGLTVVLWPDASAAEVTAQVWYRIGALHERPGTTGIAHLFEHMMLRPSKYAPDGGLMFSRTLGAEIEANTYFKSTSYRITVAPESLETILRYQADVMVNLPLDAEMLAREKEAVRSEYLIWDNDPMLQLLPRLAETSYPGHEAQYFVTGRRSDLDAITAADCLRFYKQGYAPNNAVLLIVGRFDKAATLALVQRYFGVVARARDAVLPPDLKTLPKAAVVNVPVPSDTHPLVLTYSLPFAPLPAKEDAALHRAWRMLFDGEASFVGDALINAENLTGAISTNYGGIGQRLVMLDLRTASSERALRVIDHVVDLLQGVEESTYQRFAFAARADLLRQLQSPSARTQMLGFYLVYRQGIAALRTDLQETIPLKDVKAAAAKYLKGANRQAVFGVSKEQ